MTGTQIIVLALLVAAFVSGWVARGADAGRRSGGDAGSADAARALAAAGEDLQTVIDAWLDDEDPAPALASFEGSRAALRDAAAARRDVPALRDAADALDQATGVFGDLRAGLPLTAQASNRLGEVEDALARAARTVALQSDDGLSANISS